MSTARNIYLDFVRGAGILLVVFGHLTDWGQPWREWVYSFHMPLFFLLSGVFANPDVPWKTFIRKKARSLYLPFAVFLTIDLAISFFLQLRTDSFIICVKTMIVAAALKFTGVRFSVINGPIWFLFVLFVVQIAFFFAAKKRPILYATCALSVPVTVLLHFLSVPRGQLWCVAVVEYGFFTAGYLLRNVLNVTPSVSLREKKGVLLAAVLLPLLFAHLVSAALNDNVDIAWFKVGNHISVFYLNSAAGCILFLLLCAFVYRIGLLRKIVLFYGRNSMIVLTTHYYFTRRVYPFLFEAAGLSDYRLRLYTEIGLFVFTLLLLIPIVLLCRKYLYFLFGLPKPARKQNAA